MTRTAPIDRALAAAVQTKADLGTEIQRHLEEIARLQFAVKQLCGQAAEVDDEIDALLDRR